MLGKKIAFPLSKVYQLLEPGPVILLTTFQKGKANVMPMSWHMMMEFEPPLIGCVISNRNYSYAAMRMNKECVINIPTVEAADKVVACGNTSGRSVDKLKKFHLTPKPASLVRPPVLDECYANLECKVVDTKMVRKYGLFVLEVVKAWIDPSKKNPKTMHHLGLGRFMIAGKVLSLPSRMK